jgi:hypothetical protein
MKIRDGAELMLDVRTKVSTVPLPPIHLSQSRNVHISNYATSYSNPFADKSSLSLMPLAPKSKQSKRKSIPFNLNLPIPPVPPPQPNAKQLAA